MPFLSSINVPVFVLSSGICACMLLLCLGAYSLSARIMDPVATPFQRRLRGVSGIKDSEKVVHTKPSSSIIRRRVLSEIPWLQKFLERIPRLQTFERLLEQADIHVPIGVILLLSTLISFITLLLCLFVRTPVLVFPIAMLIGGISPFLFVFWKKRQRLQHFEAQLPEALDLMARALQAGHTFIIGMRMVGEEFADPIRKEFSRTIEEIYFGLDTSEALKNLANRMDSLDLKFFVTSFLIQRETGGNLAEVIDSISSLIRQRFELQARVRALSAEGKLSAMILFALPVFLLGIMYFTNPVYIMLLFTDPLGQAMLLGGTLLMVTGAIITKRMVTIQA